MGNASRTDLDQQLTRLADMDKPGLREEWRKRFSSSPAPRLSKDSMVRSIAYKILEGILGGLSTAAQRKLNTYGRQLKASGTIAVATDLRIKPGTKLVREWNNKTHTVATLEGGFEYQGRRYASLSKIAMEITGSHWSGPRFFGLKKPPASRRDSNDG